ncbi:hypothetical protein QUB08_24440 [Microcoleus sp. BR0-C5]|uniref:hypothetical protein n=1 Tax=Microcoleus sp. BR0-C5 TaxID=2818713 RepID=UPI002FD4257F
MRPVVHGGQKLHGKLQGKATIFGKVRSPLKVKISLIWSESETCPLSGNMRKD